MFAVEALCHAVPSSCSGSRDDDGVPFAKKRLVSPTHETLQVLETKLLAHPNVFSIDEATGMIILVNDNSELAVEAACHAIFEGDADKALAFLCTVETAYLATTAYQDIQRFLNALTENLKHEGQFINSGDERTNRFTVYAPNVYSKILPAGEQTDRIMTDILKHSQRGDDAAFEGAKKKAAMRLFEPEKTWQGHAASELRTILSAVAEGTLQYAPIMETWCGTVGFNVGHFFDTFR